ncbi:MAG: MFS transporter, partial [Vulcanimicrobiaceae bacterium]
AGILGQYAPLPLELPFVAYIVVLIATGIVVQAWPPETVRTPVRNPAELDLRPRVGIPESIRLQFIAPVVTAFATFALTGFYYALLPTVLKQSLHNSNVAVAGAVIFEMIAITVALLLAGRDLSSYAAMFTALFLIFPSAALLVLTQSLHSMPVLLVAGAFTGSTLALGYRGSLQVVNEIAPNDRRAEAVSAYLIACFAGNSIPVIGVGVLATYSSLLLASIVFSAVLALMALTALVVGRTTNRRVSASRS